MSQLINQSRKFRLTILLYGFVVLFNSCSNTEPELQKKNILFIAIDDLKPTLGCYGDSVVFSPNIDKLASQGTVFLNNHCQEAVCGPSRASVLTGLRPDNTKVWELFTQMREVKDSVLSLPQYFWQNGYETCGTGKIFDASCVDSLSDKLSWSTPYKIVPAYVNADYWINAKKRTAIEIADAPDSAFIDVKIANAGIKLLAEMAKGDKPFFLAVGFIKPHLPFVAPKKCWDLYNRDSIKLSPVQEHAKNAPTFSYHPSWELRGGYDDIPKMDPFPSNRQKELIHGYYACVSHVDNQVGRILHALDSLGLRENTIIVLWGDHGYHLGDHKLWGKFTNLEQSTRSPLIISAPGYKKHNTTNSPTEFIDIFPTLCELAGIENPKKIDGESLIPIFNNGKLKVKNYAVSQYSRHSYDFDMSKYNLTTSDTVELQGYSLRTDRYRYTEWHTGMVESSNAKYLTEKVFDAELYDYQVDPLEIENLLNKEEYKNVLDSLKNYMLDYFEKQNRL